MKLTGTDIVKLLETNDKAICRALVVLHNRQTTNEQITETTQLHNDRGFRANHAKMGSGMAKFYLRNNYLSEKQIAYWRHRTPRGGMRIAIYWRQLLAEAHAKEAANNVAAKKEAKAAEQDDHNRKWADYKNEYARREQAQEQLAFMKD